MALFLKHTQIVKAFNYETPNASYWANGQLLSQIMKVIDNVHLGNHKRPECKENYHPNQVKDILPDANLMICEETYSWCGRYKKVNIHNGNKISLELTL